jgi:acyl-coenzyme A thioesterase PaaI-like protein
MGLLRPNERHALQTRYRSSSAINKAGHFGDQTRQKKGVSMNVKAFQDYYPDDFAHCYGCGRLNEKGMQIKSYWDGAESVCRFRPQPHYTGGVPGYAYGGLVASLIDCHGAGTAAAAKLKDDGFALDEKPLSRFVTASLKVDYLAPTPLDTTFELRGTVAEIKGRKVIVDIALYAEGKICAKGQVVMVQLLKDTH